MPHLAYNGDEERDDVLVVLEEGGHRGSHLQIRQPMKGKIRQQSCLQDLEMHTGIVDCKPWDQGPENDSLGEKHRESLPD